MTLSRLGRVLVLVAACALPCAARAQAEPSSEAQELFERGIAAAKAGELESAFELFVRSRALSETPNTLLNLAIVQERLGRNVDALETLDALDARPDAADDPSRLEKSQKLRARALAEVAELHWTVEPADAKVTIDGSLAPPRIRLVPGAHVVRSTATGYVSEQLVLTLVRAERRELRIALEREQKDTAPAVVARTTPEVAAGPSHANGLTKLTLPEQTGDKGTGVDARSRKLRLGLSIGASVLAVAAGVATVVLLTRDSSEPSPAGELPF